MDDRQFFKVPACALILLIRNKSIYLLYRSNTGWFDSCYAIPGGCLDANESIQDACIR